MDQTYGRSAPGSQTGYACDSQGGSSGAPIVDPATGRVIALHHFGDVDTGLCLNSGTKMSDVCADAGPLLSCFGSGPPSGCTLGRKHDPCGGDRDCCSNKCTGKPGRRTCK